jgi:hypothetical protein
MDIIAGLTIVVAAFHTRRGDSGESDQHKSVN